MNEQEKKALHDKYLKGELSLTELNEFLNSFSEGDMQNMSEVEEVYQTSATKWVPLRNIADEILAKEKKPKLRRLIIYRAVAAVITFAILFGGAFQGYRYYQVQNEIKNLVIVNVPVGQMKQIVLSDGSKITLASGSVFKYPRVFRHNERRVYLSEGRAFFKVAHDVAKPFTVESGNIATTALGTSFIVQHYSHYHFEKVSLYTGKVKIAGDKEQNQLAILYPGKEYNFDATTKKGHLNDFIITNDPMNNGILVYEETQLAEVLYSLSSYYNVNISFDSQQIRNINFSGKFKSKGTLNEALNSLAFIYKFTIKKTGANNYMIIN